MFNCLIVIFGLDVNDKYNSVAKFEGANVWGVDVVEGFIAWKVSNPELSDGLDFDVLDGGDLGGFVVGVVEGYFIENNVDDAGLAHPLLKIDTLISRGVLL